LPVIAAIGGAFVGGVSTFLPSYLMEKRKLKQETRSVETALISEVSALLEVIEHRRYVYGLEETVHYLKQNPGKEKFFAAKIPEHYSRIYQEHISKIGLFHPDLSAKIIRFYQLIDSGVQDISTGGFIAETGGDIEAFEELLEIFHSAVKIGREIVGTEI
jgi:hypothetical protein